MHVLQRSAQNSAGVIEHVLPHGTTPDDVELSIVIPAMNEEITVGEFMEWCKEGSTIFWSMLSFISILMVGYAYALRKGALDFRK